MRQLTLVARDQMEWRDGDDPVLPGPDAALVRPTAVSVCDFDRATISGVLNALPMPIVLGHEIVAEVVATGSNVGEVRVGTSVILPMQISCGLCPPCRAGRGNSCEAVPRLSNYGQGRAAGDYGGGMSDLLVVPYADAMLVEVPEGTSPVECVAMGCNLVDVYRCLTPLRESFPSGDVLVVGGHGVSFALYAVAMARVLGAGSVDFLGEDPNQLRAAESLGARPLRLGERWRKGGYAVVCDLSLDPRHLALGATACGPDGTLMVPWIYPSPGTPLPLSAMFRNNVSLVTGQPHTRGLIEPVLELVKSGAITSTMVPSEVLAWEEAKTSYGRGNEKRIFAR